MLETDDDIFLIYKRVETYLKNIHQMKETNQQKRLQLLEQLFSSMPPHGMKLGMYEKLSKMYGVTLPSFIVDAFESGSGSGSGSGGKKKPTLTYKNCKDIIAQIEELSGLDDIEFRLSSYFANVDFIMKRYKQSINSVIHTDFMAPTKSKDMSTEQKQLRDDLVAIVVDALGEEVAETLITRKYNNGVIVKEDGFGVDDINNEDAGMQDGFDQVEEGDEEWNCMVYNDINRINFNIKFKYDKRVHFKDTINQYQGLQHKQIPQQVFDDLIDLIEKHGLADKTKTDPKERYAKLRKEHITMFLSESGHSLYYEDKQLIYSKITTKDCPNIQKYEKGLFADFEQLVEVFLQLPEEKVDRKNFLNTHYVLRQLLKKRGVYVPEHDLNIIKTPARMRKHDEIYQLCCQHLGWNFTPLG